MKCYGYKIGSLLLVFLLAFATADEERDKNEDKQTHVLALLASSDEIDAPSTEESSEKIKSDNETKSEDGSNESTRSARSIGNIARLLLGGNVPPDHPLVKYPDPMQPAASATNPVVAAVAGMNQGTTQIVPAVQLQPQQALLQQQQLQQQAFQHQAAAVQQQPVASGTFSVPSFLLPSSISNFLGGGQQSSAAPAPAYSQNVYNTGASQNAVNSYPQQQQQYNQAQSTIPNYEAPTSTFNTAGNTFNTQANTFSPQTNSQQVGTNTFSSTTGFNGVSNVSPSGYPAVNGGNSYQTNGASYNTGSGNQYNSAGAAPSYSAPAPQAQQPYESSGPPYQAPPSSFSNQTPWQGGGTHDSSYYGSSNSYLTSSLASNNYQSQPASYNSQQQYSQPTQTQQNSYNSQFNYQNPAPVQQNSYNSQPNYQNPAPYNNVPAASPQQNSYNQAPSSAPQSNMYNNVSYANNNQQSYSPPAQQSYSPAPQYSSSPPSSYSNLPSNTYGNYQPPQSNNYSPPQQQNQQQVSSYNGYSNPPSGNGYNNPQSTNSYNNPPPPANSYNNPPPSTNSYNNQTPSANGYGYNNNYNSQNYGAQQSNSYPSQSYNAPTNSNSYAGKQNIYSSQQNSFSKPYPNKAQNLNKYPQSEGKGRPKGEYDQLKPNFNGGSPRKENNRKPSTFANSYGGSIDITYQPSKQSGSYAAPPPSSLRDLRGGRSANIRSSNSRERQSQSLPISLKVPGKTTTITYQRYPNKKSFPGVSGPTVRIYASKKSDTVAQPSNQQHRSSFESKSVMPLTRLSTVVKPPPPPPPTPKKVTQPQLPSSSRRHLTTPNTNAYLANFRKSQIQRRNSQVFPEPSIINDRQSSVKVDPVIVPSITIFQSSYV